MAIEAYDTDIVIVDSCDAYTVALIVLELAIALVALVIAALAVLEAPVALIALVIVTLAILGLAATAGFVIGAALFAADVAMRAYLGHRLFPFAAPTGGMLLIIGWLLVAIAALAARR